MKILIIDDEPGLALMISKLLALAGIPDCGAANGPSEAIDILAADPEIRLVITDVVMEELDGFSLRDSLMQNFTYLKFIFISGYDLSEYTERIGDAPVLMKPVDIPLLVQKIAELTGIFADSAPASPVPRAVAAAPKATPKPVAQATPTATPVAQPRPVATPVAKATPAATPVAQPRPVATPTASPSPVASPPKAVPVAAPRPVASPVAKASPKAVAVKASATPTPGASPRPAAVAATPKPSAAVAAVPVPQVNRDLPPDDTVGQVIGDYRVDARIGENQNGGIYRATQNSVSRTVRLYTLGQDNAADPARRASFVSNASAKANVRHPAMLAVYEANEISGVSFYACEHVDGASLEEMASAGQLLPALTALKVIEMVADVMAYLAREKVKHVTLRAASILIDQKGNPRLANIAADDPDAEISATEEMASLANILLPLLAEGPLTPAVSSLLGSLTSPASDVKAWPALGQKARALFPKTAPTDAYKLDARERAAIQALEAAKKQQKKMVLVSSAGSLGLLAVILVVAYFVLFAGTAVKTFDRMIEIPAGPFIYQDGETVTLPRFWIDEYEVTIAQYAEFLAWVEQNPEKAAALAHPEMASGKSHYPADWVDQDLPTGPMPGYYTRARRWGQYMAAALDVNSPVFGLDWYDAYAYAAWKGRRLPTEQEWEKAARGTEGFIYPWGNELDTRIVNSGADANPNPDLGGEIDGYKRWSPVDAMKGDRSPFGVMGMGGNVSEWTDTYEESPDLFGDKVPVIRGGNWSNPDVDTRRRQLKLYPLQQDLALGFRTASDTAPSE